MKGSDIQWCDDTVNPVMGCDGCELWPRNSGVKKGVVDWLSVKYPEIERIELDQIVQETLGHRETSKLYEFRLCHASEIDDRVRQLLPSAVPQSSVKSVFEGQFKCYAAKVTGMREGKKGYPKTFDQATAFPDRMLKVAKYSCLKGTSRSDKPWLNGCRRLIFVSDMGDALSKDISFEFLKTEIVDVVTTEKGKRHIWLWLTKRPTRMLDFDKYLESKGISWPDNLVAMTSVTTQGFANRIDQLRSIRAKFKGLSVEPLFQEVTLNLEGIDWCIVGGESGARKNIQAFDLSWARSLQEQCQEADTCFFLKQLGSKVTNVGQPQKFADTHGGTWEEWPYDLRVRQVPEGFKV